MEGIKIVVDSVSCVPEHILRRYDIRVIPFYFKIEGRIYRDGVDITTDEIYKFIEKGYPFEAYPPKVEDFLDTFNSIKEKRIIFVSLSSTLSGSIRNCRIAIKMIKDKDIRVIDSLNAGGGEALIVMKIIKLLEEGREISEIINEGRKLPMIIKTVVLLDTVKHVYRTGRIPRFLSDFGSYLSLKPILLLYRGRIKPVTVVRDKMSGVKKLIDILKREKPYPKHAIVMHVDEEKNANFLFREIKKQSSEEVYITEFSPIMGFATGKGVIGVSFYPEVGG